MTLFDKTLDNAEKLRVLNARIAATFELRDKAPEGHAQWRAACTAFHEQYADLFFPGGEAGWQAFQARRSEGIELALTFLEVDQYTFRSGYHKQIVWDRLKNTDLPVHQVRRLEEVAISYLHKRLRHEFWHMANFMRRQGTASFWERVQILGSDNGTTAGRKARWLLLASRNAPVRRWIREELFRRKYQPNYIPRLDFATESAEAPIGASG